MSGTRKQIMQRNRHAARKKRQADCKRKISYATFDAAQRAADGMRQGGRAVLFPYACEFGGDALHYHLGHSAHLPARR